MWPNPQETADLVTFTEEVLSGKLHFLCGGNQLTFIKVTEENSFRILQTFSFLTFHSAVLFLDKDQRKSLALYTLIHKAAKWPNVLCKFCSVHTTRYQNIFGHFSTLYMKVLSMLNETIDY